MLRGIDKDCCSNVQTCKLVRFCRLCVQMWVLQAGMNGHKRKMDLNYGYKWIQMAMDIWINYGYSGIRKKNYKKKKEKKKY